MGAKRIMKICLKTVAANDKVLSTILLFNKYPNAGPAILIIWPSRKKRWFLFIFLILGGGDEWQSVGPGQFFQIHF
jgi:hypothetical protein